VRFWVNGQLVIDNWTDHSSTTNTSAEVSRVAGVKYDLTMEFLRPPGEGGRQTAMEVPGQETQIIPQSLLSP
jgi:hypothetical protein